MRQQSDPAPVVMPGMHRVASLLRRWLLGTHQGSVSAEHLQAYLNEYTFRFNRRHSRRRGMLFYRLLEQAVVAEPITYRSLFVNSKPTGRRPSTASRPGRVVPVQAVHRPWCQTPRVRDSLTQIDSPLPRMHSSAQTRPDDRLRPRASARPAAALLVFRESSHGQGVVASGVMQP